MNRERLVWWTYLLSGFMAAILFVTFDLAAQENDADKVEKEYGYIEDNSEAQKPMVQGTFQVKRVAQTINEESRLNPDNETFELNPSKTSLLLRSQISDFIDQDKLFHWLFRSYAYSEWEPDNENSKDEDLVRVDELYLDWADLNWFISLGKRRNTWGTSSVWNPLNVVVPAKDPLSTEPQTEGHPNLLINFANEPVSFDLVFTRDYDRDWESRHDRWGARFSLIFDDIEIGLYYFDGEAFDEDEISGVRSTTDYNTMTGISYSSNFFDNATIYTEVARFSDNARFYFDEDGQSVEKDEMVYRAVLGSVITLDGDLSILVEAYHNSEGYTVEEEKNYYIKLDSTLDHVKSSILLSDTEKESLKNAILSQYQSWSMNQNYFLFTLSKAFWEKYSVSFNYILAEDESFITTLSGSYNISDYYLMEITLRSFAGSEDSEFGNVTYTSSASLTLSSSF